jgi:hypothetical protein
VPDVALRAADEMAGMSRQDSDPHALRIRIRMRQESDPHAGAYALFQQGPHHQVALASVSQGLMH